MTDRYSKLAKPVLKSKANPTTAALIFQTIDGKPRNTVKIPNRQHLSVRKI